MLTAKTNLGSFTLPSAWFEITLKQFAALYEKRQTDEEGRVSFNEYDAARTLVSDVSIYNQADASEIEHLVKEWLATLGPMPDWLLEEAPYKVAGVRPPVEIGACTQLQVESAKMIVRDMAEEQNAVDYILLAVPMIAIFLYPQMTGKPLTDTDQIEEIIPIIEALPVTEGLPLAAFFLAQLEQSDQDYAPIFQRRIPESVAQKQADDEVPQLAEFREMAQIRAVAHDMRITDDKVQQLPYDVFMERLCYLHLQSLWQYEYGEAQKRASKNK